MAGLLFGSNFAPPTHLIDLAKKGNTHYSEHGIDYVLSHFSGIMLTAIVQFVVYSLATNNKPHINPQIALPAWLSGVVWGVAQMSWFIANDKLGITTAYPLITTGPGVVGALWGVCVFGEIRGRKNFVILGLAVLFSFLACALITLSKIH